MIDRIGVCNGCGQTKIVYPVGDGERRELCNGCYFVEVDE